MGIGCVAMLDFGCSGGAGACAKVAGVMDRRAAQMMCLCDVALFPSRPSASYATSCSPNGFVDSPHRGGVLRHGVRTV